MQDKVFITNGCRNIAIEERQKYDYYATEPKAVEELLKLETLNNVVLEPCCGEGHISKVLENNGFKVYSSDLIDRGFGYGNKNIFNYSLDEKGYLKYEDKLFLKTNKFDIVTNPPYKNVKNYVEHMLKLLNEDCKLILFLKLTFLESRTRRELFDNSPFKHMYVPSGRINCAKNGLFDKYKSSAIAYGWFVWEKGFKGKPTIDWFN